MTNPLKHISTIDHRHFCFTGIDLQVICTTLSFNTTQNGDEFPFTDSKVVRVSSAKRMLLIIHPTMEIPSCMSHNCTDVK